MKRTLVTVFGVVLIVALGITFFDTLRAAHDMTFIRLFPNAERAYAYGNRHLDATHPDNYDMDLAARFFENAYELDPSYPFIQHQRARVAFLRGDFANALSRINAEIEHNPNGSSYYVRGLIKGYMGDFEGAAKDYETYLKTDPKNWAALNDYAWVLLKDDRPDEALIAVDWGLMAWTDNPWLLNSKATAHFELGQLELARDAVVKAQEQVAHVTEADWLQAYPGNDPLIAKEGIESFRKAVEANMHTISLALEKQAQSMR